MAPLEMVNILLAVWDFRSAYDNAGRHPDVCDKTCAQLSGCIPEMCAMVQQNMRSIGHILMCLGKNNHVADFFHKVAV